MLGKVLFHGFMTVITGGFWLLIIGAMAGWKYIKGH